MLWYKVISKNVFHTIQYRAASGASPVVFLLWSRICLSFTWYGREAAIDLFY